MAPTDFFALPNATTEADGLMATDDKEKLDGIAAGATVNQTNAYLLARTNHTGEQATSTITGFDAAVSAAATSAAAAAAADAITTHEGSGDPHTQYEDALGDPSTSGYLLSSTTGGVRSWTVPPAGLTTEEVQDIVGAMMLAGANAIVSYNDTTNKITITNTGGGGGGTANGELPGTDAGDLLRGGPGAASLADTFANWITPSTAYTTSGDTFTNPANAIDADDATFFISANWQNQIDLGTSMIFRVDLGTARKVGSWAATHDPAGTANQLILEYSTNNSTWILADTETIAVNYTGRQPLLNPITARYWRLRCPYSNDGDDTRDWRLSNFALYNVPVTVTNVATAAAGAELSFSDTSTITTLNDPDHVLDDDKNSYYFIPRDTTVPAWIEVDLGQERAIVAGRIRQGSTSTTNETTVTFEHSSDGSTWTTVVAVGGSPNDTGVWDFGDRINARYWRVLGAEGTSGDNWMIKLVQFFEELGTGPGALEALSIGTVDQVLTVVDVGGAPLPAWADLPAAVAVPLRRLSATWFYAGAIALTPTGFGPVWDIDMANLGLHGVSLYSKTDATATAAVDIERSTNRGTSWSSVFTTRPTIASAAHSDAQAHVFATSIVLAERDLLRAVIYTAGTGVTDLSIRLTLEELP